MAGSGVDGVVLQKYADEFLAGNRENEEKFVLECQRILKNQALGSQYQFNDKNGNSKMDLEDHINNCWVKILNEMNQRDEIPNFVPWMCKVAKNAYFAEYNKQKKKCVPEVSLYKEISRGDEVIGTLADIIPSNEDVERTVIRKFAVARKEFYEEYQELRRKHEKYFAALQTCYYDGLKVKEAAELLGESEASINNWLKRGRDTMRDSFKERELQEDLYYEMDL